METDYDVSSGSHIPKEIGMGICGSHDRDNMGMIEDVKLCMHTDGTCHVIDEDGMFCPECKAGMERGFRRAAVWEGNPEWDVIDKKSYHAMENLKQIQDWRRQ